MPNNPLLNASHMNTVLRTGLTSAPFRHIPRELLTPIASPAPSTAPTRPATPDPSRVYGYIALVDPATGEKHLAHDADNPQITYGYPDYFHVTFCSDTGGPRTMTLDISGGSGVIQEVVPQPDGSLDYWGPNSRGIAWYYDFQLNADRTESAPRVGGPAGVIQPGRTCLISYNPDEWWFAGIDVGNVRFADRWVDLVRCDPPFPDLPNTD